MPYTAKMKLGKHPAKIDSRTLRLGKYLAPNLPAPPVSVDWFKGKTSFGMMLNDTLGDCTIAGVAHAIQVWSLNTGIERTITDARVLFLYEKWDGYNPADPSTDQGGEELRVLNLWKKYGAGGVALKSYVDPNVLNFTEIKRSIQLFGGVYIGVQLPLSAQNQPIWTVVPDNGTGSTVPGSWGGHCVFVAAYDEEGLTCITWGATLKMTWDFWKTYVDEAHCLLSADWLTSKGSPSGLNLAQLEADLRIVSS
jgi:hypothetical protein